MGIAIALTTASLVVALVVVMVRRWLRDRRFVWRTENITPSILRDDDALKIGQYLNLDQRLLPDESGWTNMKINIPEHWVVQSVACSDGRVTVMLLDGSAFQLHRRNVGPLSFDILDGGDDKTDHQLEVIWKKHALAHAA